MKKIKFFFFLFFLISLTYEKEFYINKTYSNNKTKNIIESNKKKTH